MLNVTDNACGAVARIILKNTAAVPLEHVLPVLLDSLPLKKDFAEYVPVVDCISVLFRDRNPVLFAHMQKLMSIFGELSKLEKTSLKAPTRTKLVEMMTLIRTHDGFENLFHSLSAEVQQSLSTFLQ